jgi:hypothetical protein
MRYKLGMRDDGWLVIDTASQRVASFGGCILQALSVEEAHLMLGMLQSQDRALAALSPDLLPGASAKPAPSSALAEGRRTAG